LDALVGAAAISGLVNTTCIRVNVHDVHSMDSGYALADDPMEEERGGEGGFNALNLRSSALFNDRSASSVVDDSHSDEFAGSSGDAVNMEESNSTTDSHAVHDNNVNNADDDDDDDEAFVFARRDSGEQDDTVLCQESDEIVIKTDHHENQSSRALVIVDESAILPNSWCDSHFVDEEMQSGLQCSSILPLLSGGPPRLAVSDSFELMPRSASALPVPVTHVSSTPVTKSYLDFERRNKSGGSAVKQQHHQSLFRSHSPIAMSPEETLTPVDISETEGSDASSQPFVSTLPAMSRAAAQTSESPSRPQTLRTMADESLVSVLSSSSEFGAPFNILLKFKIFFSQGSVQPALAAAPPAPTSCGDSIPTTPAAASNGPARITGTYMEVPVASWATRRMAGRDCSTPSAVQTAQRERVSHSMR
jgi:hypothetical protein